jgi:hypothetical protein
MLTLRQRAHARVNASATRFSGDARQRYAQAVILGFLVELGKYPRFYPDHVYKPLIGHPSHLGWQKWRVIR